MQDKSIFSLYKSLSAKLQNIYELREAQQVSKELMAAISNLKAIDWISQPSLQLSKEQFEVFLEKEQQILAGKPLQHVIGQVEFFDCKLLVNEHVLIPRVETEELVHWILATIPKDKPLRIIDIGCGSACISLAVKSKLPLAEVYAFDISEQALSLAEKNADLNNLEINFIQGDVLLDEPIRHLGIFDVWISNPPYIPVNQINEIDEKVLKNEPHSALFVPNDSPILFYERILYLAKVQLNKSGYVFFELNDFYAEEVKNCAIEMGFKNVELKQDMQNKWRFLKIEND